MKSPTKAIVLAAGFGTRLHPFTLDCPKALVPLKGKPMLAHTLDRLASWGVKEVAINLHTLADQLVEALPEITPRGMKTVLSFEPELLGTGGALRRLEWFFDETPLWICNADIWAELNPEVLVKEFHKREALACLWLVPEKGPGTVETTPEGAVTNFRGKGATFSGLHLVTRKLLNYLPEQETFCSVIPAYETAIAKGERVIGIEVPKSQWEDVGTPEALLKANEGSVVFPGAQVGTGVTLKDAIIGSGAVLKGRGTVSGCITSPMHGLTGEERGWFPKVGSVELLSVRGSDRSYRRCFTAKGSVLLSVSGEERPENFRMASHTRFLQRNGIRVPDVLVVKKKGRVLMLEDVGRVHVLDRLVQGSDARNRSDMRKVLDLVVTLHRIEPPDKLEPPFSPGLVKWERSLFADSFLGQFDPESDRDALVRELRLIGSRLLRQPRVLIHRDLQSTNLLWWKGKPVLIDFQGMRIGQASYDLGSLFADPYVNRSRGQQESLLERYNERAEIPVSLEDYKVGVLQRLCQALGAYGRLSALPGTQGFVQHIPAAVEQMRLWADDGVLKEWADDFSKRHSPHNQV